MPWVEREFLRILYFIHDVQNVITVELYDIYVHSGVKAHIFEINGYAEAIGCILDPFVQFTARVDAIEYCKCFCINDI